MDFVPKENVESQRDLSRDVIRSDEEASGGVPCPSLLSTRSGQHYVPAGWPSRRALEPAARTEFGDASFNSRIVASRASRYFAMKL